MNYTQEDVIMWADDPRVEGAIGKECYFADNPNICLNRAIEDNRKSCEVLNSVDYKSFSPFRTGRGSISYSFIIVKKEPKVKYVPYDLSKKEDRDELRGKWIRYTEWEDEYLIDYFTSAKNNGEGRWVMGGYYDGRDLLAKFTFVDTGLPVGKPVEEMDE